MNGDTQQGRPKYDASMVRVVDDAVAFLRRRPDMFLPESRANVASYLAREVAEDAHLFSSPTAYQFGDSPVEGQSQGHQLFAAPSPPYGAVITYRLATRQPGARIVILDASGDTMQTLTGPGAAGINRVAWAFGGKPAARPPLGREVWADTRVAVPRGRYRNAFTGALVCAEGSGPSGDVDASTLFADFPVALLVTATS